MSNLTHFGVTFVEVDSCCIYFVEIDPFWIFYICRTWLIRENEMSYVDYVTCRKNGLNDPANRIIGLPTKLQ